MSTRPREFRFPVEATATGGREVRVDVAGKTPLAILPPPEFRGPDPTVWSPEDLFVGSAAGCLAVTATGLAERAGLPLELHIAAEGVVGRRDDGRFGFTSILQTIEVVTEAGREEEARELVEKAEETCLVSVSLALPVETTIEVGTR